MPPRLNPVAHINAVCDDMERRAKRHKLLGFALWFARGGAGNEITPSEAVYIALRLQRLAEQIAD